MLGRQVLVLGARQGHARQQRPAAPYRDLPSFNHYTDGAGAWVSYLAYAAIRKGLN